MRKAVNIFLAFTFCASITSYAQQQILKKYALGADVHYGWVLPEYKNFIYLVHKPVTGLELNFFTKTNGTNSWEQVYRYPEYGLGFSYSTLGNDRVFGKEVALYPYFQPFVIRTPKFLLSTKIGFGIGYTTKKFDVDNNYENISVGSHFNLHFCFKLGTRINITEAISVNGGLSFAHYSNGNTAEPNLGHNMFTTFAGINYGFGKTAERKKEILEPHKKDHEFASIYAFGGKHTRALQSNYYFTSSLSGEYKYYWKRMIHIGEGVDLFYDSSTKVEMNVPGKEVYRSLYDFRTGIHFSQELIYHRFSLILQEGLYLGLTDHVNNKKMYNRAIFRCKISDHLLVHFSMKSHLHILDYPELGMGYYFTKTK